MSNSAKKPNIDRYRAVWNLDSHNGYIIIQPENHQKGAKLEFEASAEFTAVLTMLESSRAARYDGKTVQCGWHNLDG